jgi:DNA invertase Pin-like site-specific DNA recombinase
MGSLSEFERDLLKERTKAGMKAAQKRGKHVGRPKSLSNGQVQHMKEMLDTGKTQSEVAELLGVSANTIGRAIREKWTIKPS